MSLPHWDLGPVTPGHSARIMTFYLFYVLRFTCHMDINIFGAAPERTTYLSSSLNYNSRRQCHEALNEDLLPLTALHLLNDMSQYDITRTTHLMVWRASLLDRKSKFTMV